MSAPSVSAHPDDDDDDDVVSVASNPPAVDKTIARFAAYIHDQFPDSRPFTAPSQAPHGFEVFYTVTDPPDSNRPLFHLYPRVAEIVDDVRDRADKLAQSSKPLLSVLPKCCLFHSVADVADFTAPCALNSDFSRLTENKSISVKRAGTISFFEMERVESSTRSLLEGQSYSLWLLSGLSFSLRETGLPPLTRLSSIPPFHLCLLPSLARRARPPPWRTFLFRNASSRIWAMPRFLCQSFRSTISWSPRVRTRPCSIKTFWRRCPAKSRKILLYLPLYPWLR